MKGARQGLIGVVALSAVGVAAWIFGPELWDVWQFKRTLDREQQTLVAANPRAADLAQTCGLCHGQDGNSKGDNYPRLAGQPAAYLLMQLNDFAAGRRAAPQMQPFAMQLTAEERQLIGAYYAALPAASRPALAGGSDSAVAESLGRCTGCHSAALQGAVSPIVAPRLAGQGRRYLVNQLEAFKAGRRNETTGAMVALVRDLDHAQIEALAAALVVFQPLGPAQAAAPLHQADR